MIPKVKAQTHQFVLGDLDLLNTICQDPFQNVAVDLETIDDIPNQRAVACALLVVGTIAAIVITKLLVRSAMDEFATVIAVFLFEEHSFKRLEKLLPTKSKTNKTNPHLQCFLKEIFDALGKKLNQHHTLI